MNENCKSCIYVESLNKEVAELKIKVNSLDIKINDVEKETVINQEQTKMVFKILSEIKDSIEKIADKIDEIESRPSKLLYTVGGGVIVAIILAGIKFLN